MAIIDNDFKLIGNTEEGADISEFELYSLNEDPFEAENIVEKKIAVARDLRDKLDLWYEDIMASENIKNIPRIGIGSDQEKHTILNRNDARGMQLIWAQDDMYVRWDLDILKKGNYRMKIHFRNPIEHPGELVVRIGTQNFTLKNEEVNTKTIIYPKVELNPGKVTFE